MPGGLTLGPIKAPYDLSPGSSLLLDALRAVSAQAVLVGHALVFFGYPLPGGFVMQNYAVLVFFLLSGFLIVFSTVRKRAAGRAYSFRHFFVDRFARIYTGYLPALLLVLLLDLLHVHYFPEAYPYYDQFTVRDFLGNLVLLQEVPGVRALTGKAIVTFGSADPFWTLAVEWWLYLFFGWLTLRILPRRGAAWWNVLILLPLLIVPALHTVGGRGNGLFLTWWLGAGTYVLVAGGWLQDLRGWRALLLTGLLAGLSFLRWRATGTEYDVVLAGLAAAGLAVAIEAVRNWSCPPALVVVIRKTAAFSFTLYLVHHSVLDLLRSAYGGTWSPAVLLVVGCVLSNVVAAGLGLYAEVGWTRAVKGWLYRRFLRGGVAGAGG